MSDVTELRAALGLKDGDYVHGYSLLLHAAERIRELEALVMLAYKEGYSDGHVGSDDGLTEVRKHLGEETPQ